MKTITINKNKYELSTDWSEIEQNEFMRIAFIRTTLKNTTDESRIHSARMCLFFILSDVPIRYTREIEPDQWADILPHVDWAFSTPILKTNPLKVIKVGVWLRIHGPVGLLDTSTFGEFMQADEAFLSFMNAKNEAAAWLLLAILWRSMRGDIKMFRKDPEKWNGDVRSHYNTDFAKQQSAVLQKRLPQYYAIAAVMIFSSFRTYKLEKNELLRPLFYAATGGTSSKLGWLDTILAQANYDPTKVNQIADQNCMVVLVALSRQIEITQKQMK